MGAGPMKCAILTSTSGVSLKRKGEDIAGVVIPFTLRLVWTFSFEGGVSTNEEEKT
jgi:hypothetical protein